jgi:hypothetical protein
VRRENDQTPPHNHEDIEAEVHRISCSTRLAGGMRVRPPSMSQERAAQFF